MIADIEQAAIEGGERVWLLSPATGRPAMRIDRKEYEALRDCVLAALPLWGAGLTWAEVVELVTPALPEGMFRDTVSVRWYSRAVQFDLEARGQIERVSGSKPVRLRRCGP